MKITIKQLKQLIKEQVRENASKAFFLEEGWSDKDSSLDSAGMADLSDVEIYIRHGIKNAIFNHRKSHQFEGAHPYEDYADMVIRAANAVADRLRQGKL